MLTGLMISLATHRKTAAFQLVWRMMIRRVVGVGSAISFREAKMGVEIHGLTETFVERVGWGRLRSGVRSRGAESWPLTRASARVRPVTRPLYSCEISQGSHRREQRGGRGREADDSNGLGRNIVWKEVEATTAVTCGASYFDMDGWEGTSCILDRELPSARVAYVSQNNNNVPQFVQFVLEVSMIAQRSTKTRTL